MLVVAMASEDAHWVAGRYPSKKSYDAMHRTQGELAKAIEGLEKEIKKLNKKASH